MASASDIAKQEADQRQQQMAVDTRLEDIQYHDYVLEKIKRGRADIAAGNSQSTNQAREKLSRWLKR